MDIEFDIEEVVPEKIGGYCGILTPFLTYGLITISILMHSWFTLPDNALSDLGEAGVVYNDLFNIALIIPGILVMVFVFAMLRRAESRLGTVGLVSVGIAALFLILTGVFPKGTAPHAYMAYLFYSFSAVGLALYGIDELIELEYPWTVFIWSSIGFALISMGLVSSLSPGGVAIYEIIGSIPLMQFVLVYGTRLLTE